jgi:hypothetical protein
MVNGQNNQPYLYWLWFGVGAMGSLRLVGQKVRSNQTYNAMQGGWTKWYDMICGGLKQKQMLA